jgi:DNA-binding NarL/FixJ family response regulator
VNRTRILVADSLPIFRSGVKILLERESDLNVVTAADLEHALVAIERDCPDIALIDLELPPRGGIAAVAALRRRCSCHVIVWGLESDPGLVLESIRAGASGFLPKTISPLGLVRALRGIAQGEAPISRTLASEMIGALHDAEHELQARERAAALSEREREVLSLVANGARNKQIASALVISEFTVKRHVQNILQKLELPSRTAAAAMYSAAVSNASKAAGAGA